MIAASNGPQEPQDDRPNNGPPATAADLQLVQRGINERWPMGRKARRRAVRVLNEIIRNPLMKAEVKVSAISTLAKIDGVNVSDRKGSGAKHQHLHLHGGQADGGAKPHEFDPDYAEYLRRRALESDVHPGPVCEIGKPGQMEARPAHRANGRDHNGHVDGNGAN